MRGIIIIISNTDLMHIGNIEIFYFIIEQPIRLRPRSGQVGAPKIAIVINYYYHHHHHHYHHH